MKDELGQHMKEQYAESPISSRLNSSYAYFPKKLVKL